MPLAEFLRADDLDDLLRVAMELRELSDDDARAIRVILDSWSDPQAVANLLIHPRFIPADIRVASLLKGLDEQDESYFQLAATVGLQSVDPTELTPVEVTTFRNRLLEIITADNGVLSSRASVSIHVFLDRAYAKELCEFLNRPKDTVRHNLLAWFVQNFELEDPDEFTPLLRSSALPDDVKQDVLQTLREHVAAEKAGEFTSVDSPLFSYIPNFRDYR